MKIMIEMILRLKNEIEMRNEIGKYFFNGNFLRLGYIKSFLIWER